ncbi:MAG: galactokinase [Thermodesulfobacteriota bacterium]
MIEPAGLRRRFYERFGRKARVYRAPGRVNLIGEHTDYNDGFVLPAAIDLATCVAAAENGTRELRVHTGKLDDEVRVDLDGPELRPRRHWSDYPCGVAVELARSGRRVPGADLMIAGEIPLGAGLSSSAALEVATAWALLDLAGETPDPREVALLCQRAENRFVGTRCGIMDQFASCHGVAASALLLDCRSLELRPVAIPGGVTLVVCDTGVKHALADGAYNRRREECEEGVRILATRLPGIRALRDVAEDDLERRRSDLPPEVYRRCRHVVAENRRVLEAAAALERGDLERAGALMYASHESLRDLYDVSCAELDTLVEAAARCPGVYGSRMMGGGFGGCTINLVREAAVADFLPAVGERYRSRHGGTPWIRACRAAGGAGRIL